MDRIRRGDIWTVSLPAFAKPRPALIVSIDPINDLRPDILIVPITTHAGPLRVPLPDKADVTGLREGSHAKCESVGPLHKSRLKARIGRLPADAWPSIDAGLARALGLKSID
jgi:mRNA-degrading endonuclease toxin of MazEF toxin-antitoxin module